MKSTEMRCWEDYIESKFNAEDCDCPTRFGNGMNEPFGHGHHNRCFTYSKLCALSLDYRSRSDKWFYERGTPSGFGKNKHWGCTHG